MPFAASCGECDAGPLVDRFGRQLRGEADRVELLAVPLAQRRVGERLVGGHASERDLHGVIGVDDEREDAPLPVVDAALDRAVHGAVAVRPSEVAAVIGPSEDPAGGGVLGRDTTGREVGQDAVAGPVATSGGRAAI